MEDSQTVIKARKKIEKLGLPVPDKPAGGSADLEWPANVGDLSVDELAEHMSWWTGWASYARQHLAEADTNAAAYKEQYSTSMSEAVFKSEGDYGTVTEMKAAIAQRPDLQKIQARVLEASGIRDMVKALLAGYEEKRATISREITRRGLEWGEQTSEGKDRFRA